MSWDVNGIDKTKLQSEIQNAKKLEEYLLHIFFEEK